MDLDKDFTKGWYVDILKYYSSPLHTMLGVDNADGRPTLTNIGANGENLTIAVLSMNRSDVTLRLLKSVCEFIPNFAGEFLIGDNGSDEDERAILRAELKQMPFSCRMLEFDRNYGVAGGRNRTFREVKTDWLLSSDNDMYFVGNPLLKIQKDIQRLGCHFLNIPILNKENQESFLYGGHLYVDNSNSRVGIGGGSVLISPHVEINVEHEPFLCTFIAGGACVMNKHTFFQCGGYEDKMFIGFEDTEFSLRVFQKGYKVGTLGVASMIHDHQKPEKIADAMYEKERFTVDYLKESARVFEQKHGFSVWNPNITKWVNSRQEELLKGTGVETEKCSDGNELPYIALVVDTPNWALDRVAGQIVKNLSGQFRFRIIYQKDFDNLYDVLLLSESCQMIHFLWRPMAGTFDDPWIQGKARRIGLSRENFWKQFVSGKSISVAVYDHLLLDGEDSQFTHNLFSSPDTIVNSYCVSSNKLKKLYDERPDIKMKPDAVIPDGVDLTLFVPQNLERFQSISGRTVRIGWVGNSKWNLNGNANVDLKGIHTIIRPAVERLQAEGYNVELVTSDRQDQMIPHRKMPSFYNELDLYVCASICEGTPNPVLESMACGLPVISTDVGIVPDAFGPLQKEFILAERSVDCMVEKLKRLLDHPEMFARLSAENLESIKSWDWKIMVQNFRQYFERCLQENDNK